MKQLGFILVIFMIIGCTNVNNKKQPQPSVKNEKSEKLIFGTRMEKTDDKKFSQSVGSKFHNERYTVEERMILKSILQSLGYQVNTKTILWDKATEDAVREFQKDYQLPINGLLDKETLWSMTNVIKESKLITISGNEEKTMPFNYPFWYGYMKNRQVKPGDILKYFDYESGKFKYAEVESISGSEARLYDYEKDEYYYINIDDIE